MKTNLTVPTLVIIAYLLALFTAFNVYVHLSY